MSWKAELVHMSLTFTLQRWTAALVVSTSHIADLTEAKLTTLL